MAPLGRHGLVRPAHRIETQLKSNATYVRRLNLSTRGLQHRQEKTYFASQMHAGALTGAMPGSLRLCKQLGDDALQQALPASYLCGKAFMIASISFAELKLGPDFSIGTAASSASARATSGMHRATFATGRAGSTREAT